MGRGEEESGNGCGAKDHEIEISVSKGRQGQQRRPGSEMGRWRASMCKERKPREGPLQSFRQFNESSSRGVVQITGTVMHSQSIAICDQTPSKWDESIVRMVVNGGKGWRSVNVCAADAGLLDYLIRMTDNPHCTVVRRCRAAKVRRPFGEVVFDRKCLRDSVANEGAVPVRGCYAYTRYAYACQCERTDG